MRSAAGLRKTGMADRLCLSYWLRGYTEHNMLRHYHEVLKCFPFSQLRPHAIFRLRAVDFAEPPLLEREWNGKTDVAGVIEMARWHHAADCACELESAWDLWQFDGDWHLRPATVFISCYGPLFPSELGEQVRLELGLDSQFLPQFEVSDNLVPVRENIRSLLRLVEEIDAKATVARRRLWSESGANFAQLLQETLRD